jgi:hypothetical protein
MMTSNETIRILNALRSVQFRPFNDFDFQAFAGADCDAQMGEPQTFELDRALTDLIGEMVNESIVVVSGPNIEVHGVNTVHEDVCLKLVMDRLA